jgi:hypothetical protein
MNEPDRWTRLGWHGIAFDVPEDWSPDQVTGDYANGYLRVEDGTHVRLELRWETAGRRIAPAATLVDNYLKQARKKIGRRIGEPTIDRGRTVKELARHDHEAFTWRGGFHAHGLLLVAAESRRIVHLRVFFEEGREDKALARRIFGSLRAEARDGYDEWGAFGFRFEVASRWKLEQSSMRTGCLQFVFRAAAHELEVARVSLADLLLRKSPLEKWFEGFFAKALRGFGYTVRADGYRGHAAAVCQGALKWRAQPLGILRRRRQVTGLAWHCPEADKLFAVRAVTATPNDPLVARCADSIRCHGT